MEFSRTFDTMTDRVVNENGTVNFGTYNDYIKQINLLDIHKPFGKYIPNKFNNFRLKEWEAFQAGNDDYFILGAVYNTKTIGINIITIYDRQQKKIYPYKEICCPNKQVIASNLVNSKTSFYSSNFHIQITNNLENNLINIQAEINDKHQPSVNLSIKAYHNKEESLTICHPFTENRPLYSHKAFMPMEGELILGSKTTKFNKLNSFTIIDDHKGYYPYTLKYDWVTGYGFDDNKELKGFNLTRNQIINPNINNENCLWYKGMTYLLPAVTFERIKEGQFYWHIQDEYDMVNLNFYPIQKLSMKINLLIVSCNYEAPFGTFKGYIRTGSGEKVTIDDCFGMGEKKKYRL